MMEPDTMMMRCISSRTPSTAERQQGHWASGVLLRGIVAVGLQVGWSVLAGGQASAGVSSSATSPVVTAGFAVPSTRMADWHRWRLLGACQSAFERNIQIDSVVNAPGHSALPVDSEPWIFLPSTAVAAGRQCLHRLGGGDTLSAFAWPPLLRFAIGINDDSLARMIVTRQLVLAGPSVRDRAQVLESVIDLLLHNRWGKSYTDHRTPAHDTLARWYATQLDTMQPAAQVLATRFRVRTAVNTMTLGWNIDTAMAQARYLLQFIRSVPVHAVPPEDQEQVRGDVSSAQYQVAELTYLKTLTHASLTRFIVTRDSLLTVPPGQMSDSVLGHPAGRIDGYWFNTPAGSPPPVVPAPGVVTLLWFLDQMGEPSEGRMIEFDQLRQLHVRYPALQIVLVTMTRGRFQDQDEDLRDQPEREAALIHHYLTNTLQLPGLVCVIPMRFHTEPGLTAVPVASPILDRYHLDPREIQDHDYLVDAEGWVVQDNGWSVDGHYIQRLLAP